MKADRGYKVIILDGTDYYERVNTLLAMVRGPYVYLTGNPQPKMVLELKHFLKQCGYLRLQVSPRKRFL